MPVAPSRHAEPLSPAFVTATDLSAYMAHEDPYAAWYADNIDSDEFIISLYPHAQDQIMSQIDASPDAAEVSAAEQLLTDWSLFYSNAILDHQALYDAVHAY